MKKYLNSPRYTELLRIVGRSPKPLSIYAIMKHLHRDSYVYEMIKNLCPSHYRPLVQIKLCALEDLPKIDEKPDIKNRLIELLDRDLRLGYRIEKGGRDDNHDDSSSVKIRSKEMGNRFVITIWYGSGPIVLMEFKFKNTKLIGISPLSIVTLDRNEVQIERQYHTAVRVHRSGKHVIYYYSPKISSEVSTKVDYLDATDASKNGVKKN